jgi:hypothetical protein
MTTERAYTNKSSMGSLLTWNEEQKQQSAHATPQRPASAKPHVEEFKQTPPRVVHEQPSQW